MTDGEFEFPEDMPHSVRLVAMRNVAREMNDGLRDSEYLGAELDALTRHLELLAVSVAVFEDLRSEGTDADEFDEMAAEISKAYARMQTGEDIEPSPERFVEGQLLQAVSADYQMRFQHHDNYLDRLERELDLHTTDDADGESE